MPNPVSASTIEALPMPIWPAETHPLEPIQGWIHRAAERNYAFSTDSFIETLGLSGRDWDYDSLLNVIEPLPIDYLAEIEHCTPKRSSDGYEICGHRVSFKLISKGARRVCPTCLEEQRYIRTWFDFIPIASCPHHDVALIEGLPGDPIDWRHPEIGLTRSGTKIRAEHATEQIASKLDRFIVDTLSGECVALPDHLDGLSLNTILAASMCVGKLYRGDESHVATHENLRSICQLGFEPLLGGSEAILEFLRGADWLQQGYDKVRYNARCDGVPQMLISINDPPLRQLITDTFARARIRNGLATPSGRLSQYDGEDNRLNLKTAARRVGVTPHTMRSLLEKLSTEANHCECPRRQRISHDQLAAVQNFIADAVSSEDAANWLGCTLVDLKSLAARQLLRPDFRMGGSNHYTKSNLDSFVDKIISVAADAPSLDGQRISLVCDSSGISLAEAVSRIMREGSLSVVGHDQGSALFDGLMVAPAREAMRRACVRPKAQVRDAVTFAEAAARIGTGSHGLSALIDHSYIVVEKDVNGVDRISAESLEAFSDKYARASLYAPLLKCAPTVALKVLRKEGVKPINDWEVPGPKFVSKEEVTKLTGLSLHDVSEIGIPEKLGQKINAALSASFIPANVSIVAAPAIIVRASTGRWRLQVQESADRTFIRLASHFRATREHARHARVKALGLDPQDIWPAARVQYDRRGGFVLIDDVELDGSDQGAEHDLINRIVERAYQLHQIL